MSQTDALLADARSYAEYFDLGDLPLVPARKVAVLACMDARLDPALLLGLCEGDAHVIRNAGGVVSDDAIRSLEISQNLHGTEEIVLIRHTDCGMLTSIDQEQDVRDGIARIESSPFVPRTDSIRGFIYELETGELREVSR